MRRSAPVVIISTGMAWEKDIDYAVKVEIQAFRPDRRRRDLDNLLKALLDSMTYAGVMQDDALIEDLRVYWADEVGGMVKVTIEGIE